MLKLRSGTAGEWVGVVEADLDAFLQDHAANERKVSHSALTLAVQHPDKVELVAAMVELAQEELDHFVRVYRLLVERGASLAQDVPDPYMSKLRRGLERADVDSYLLDRLVLFAIVEARGCERFSMLSRGLGDDRLRAFYTELTQSEARHHVTYLGLARRYFSAERVERRLDALLDLESGVASSLPLTPKLH
jgi:tRNA-(ms[2]io[6]A)-hydroxylase